MSSPNTSSSAPRPAKDINLPMTRVKTIMKSSPDVETVSQESLFLITKATVRKKSRSHRFVTNSLFNK